ncbi:hypothetical protein MKX42_32255 [Paenibacillus sp. FSL R7-0204]|uniref:hypothetical protein n=1 Tax=Paenibacillus sp. FSL R7-0204 TaxID=2921675 RepID=UPI0030F72A4A
MQFLQDFSRHVTGCGAMLHDLQEFWRFEQVSAGFVAFRAGFLHWPLLLPSIVALLAGFL